MRSFNMVALNNHLIDLSTHLNDAHIDLDPLKSVLFCVYVVVHIYKSATRTHRGTDFSQFIRSGSEIG